MSKRQIALFLVVFMVVLGVPGWGQTAVTFTGSLVSMPTGVNCSTSPNWYPCVVAVDGTGNLYIGQQSPRRVVKIDTTGAQTIVANLAGRPTGIAVDLSGNVFVADFDGDQILRLSPGGIQAVIADNMCQPYAVAVDKVGHVYFSNDPGGCGGSNYVMTAPAGASSSCQGTSFGCTAAGNLPKGYAVAIDSAGDVFSAPTNGVYELPYGASTSTQLSGVYARYSSGLVFDSAGNLYGATHSGVNRITSGSETPILSGRNQVTGLAADGFGNLYILESGTNLLLKLNPQTAQFGATALGQSSAAVLTFAFNSTVTLGPVSVLTQGLPNLDFQIANGGTCTAAATYNSGDTCTVKVTFAPTAPGTRSGVLSLTDDARNTLVSLPVTGSGQGPIVAFPPGIITTIAGNGGNNFGGDDGPATAASLDPLGLTLDAAENLYFVDDAANSQRVRRITPDGIITTFAGGGEFNAWGPVNCSTNVDPRGDGCPPLDVRFLGPKAVALARDGTMYISDADDYVIRKVQNGLVWLVAGHISYPGFSDGQGGDAFFLHPTAITLGKDGELYVADGNRIRKVTSDGTVTTIGGQQASGCDGDNSPAIDASFSSPDGLALDSQGNLYIADSGCNKIRKITPGGIVSTVAGTGGVWFGGDGGPATSALVGQPTSVAFDAAGNMYIGDATHRIRMVSPDGIINTVAGNGTRGFTGDGGSPLAAEFFDVVALATDRQGSLYISDRPGNERIRKIDFSTPSSLMFDSTPVGQTSAAKTITAANNGNGALVFSSITPMNAELDSGVTTCSVSIPLAPGASCVLGIRFAPTTAGASVTGSVVLTDNAPNSPQTIPLSGPATGSPSAPTVTIESSENPSTYGDQITLTATVAVTSGKPTGPVAFVEGETTLGYGELGSSGLATFSTFRLSAGVHNIIANYSGDSIFPPAKSDPFTQTVDPAVLTITADNKSRPFGNSNPSFTYTLNGFRAGDSPSVLSGSATCATTAQPDSPAGSYPITCSAGTLSAANYTFDFVPGTLTITPVGSPTTTLLSISPSNAAPGQVVTLTASVTQNGNPVTTGSVSFFKGNTIIGTAQIVGASPATGNTTGTATVKMPFPIGSYSLLARYSGAGSTLASSVSNSANLTVTGSYATFITLLAAQDGTSYDFSAKLLGAGAGALSGTVDFTDFHDGSLGSVPLDPSDAGPGFLPAAQYPLSNIQPDDPASPSMSNYVVPTIMADVNGDGIPDIVTVSALEDTGTASCDTTANPYCHFKSVLSVMLGNGDGTFKPRITTILPALGAYPGATTSVAAADFNHDGVLDLVVTNYSDTSIAVLLGNGDGSFSPQTPIIVGSASLGWGNYPSVVAVGDFDRDGNLDLAVGTGYARVCIMRGNGAGGFTPTQVIYGAGSWPSGIVTTDLNGDGILDLAVADTYSGAIVVLLGRSDGSFGTPQSFSIGSVPVSLAVGDLNGDTIPDLIVGKETHDIAVFQGKGDGTFQAAGAYTAGLWPQVAVGDVNGDGKPDIVTVINSVNPDGSGSTVKVFLNNGSGAFSSPLTYKFATSNGPTNPVVADTRGTGLGDIIVGTGWDTALNQYGVSVLLSATQQTANLTGVTPSTGNHSVQATYVPAAQSPYQGSNSNSVTIANLPGTTTGLTSSPNPSMLNATVAFTAVVTSTACTPVAGDGVDFLMDGTKFGSAVLDASGKATIDYAIPSGGSHSITATYGGNASCAGSTSAGLTQVVQGTTTTVLTSSPNPNVTTTPVAFTATVTSTECAPAVGDRVDFYKDGSNFGSATLDSSGKARINLWMDVVGSYSMTATYRSAGTCASSTSPVLTQVVQGGTTITLTSSPNPNLTTTPVAFTATVTSTTCALAAGDPVNFYKDGVNFGSAILDSSGKARINLWMDVVGSYSMTATYRATATCDASTSPVWTQTVVSPRGTTTTLASLPNPNVTTTPVAFTASVTSNGCTLAAGDRVDFYQNGTNFGSATLDSSGKARINLWMDVVGTYSMTATYRATTNCDSSTSTVITQTVVPPGATTTVLTSSPNPNDPSIPVAFTATVTSTSPTCTPAVGDRVDFYQNSTNFGSAVLDNSGKARINLWMDAVGTYSMTATYRATTTCAASTSPVLTQTVSYTPPVVSAVQISSLNPVVIQAGSAGLTLHVYGAGFANGAVVQWNGSARTTTFIDSSNLTATITAADIASAQTITVTVKNPDNTQSPGFSLAIDTAPNATAPVSVNVATTNVQIPQGQSGPVQVSFVNLAAAANATATCLNLPAGATCTYNSTNRIVTITTSANTPKGTYQIVVVFTVTQQTAAAMRHSPVLWAALGGGFGLPFGLLWIGGRNRKRRHGVLLGLIAFVAILMLGACGGHPTLPAPTPTPQTTTTQASLALSLTVQ